MKRQINSQIQTHIDALKFNLIDSINNQNWIAYEGDLKEALSIFELSLNKSISPNSSVVIKEIYSFLIHINFVHLEKNELDRSTELISKVYEIYHKRKVNNEVSSMLDVFIPNYLLNEFIQKLFDKIDPNDYKNFRELIKTLPLIDYLCKIVEFFKFKDENFNFSISYFFETIYSNSILTEIEKKDILKKTIIKLNNATYPFLLSLNDLTTDEYQKVKNDFYVREWSSVLRNAYINEDLSTFQNVLNIKNDRMVGLAKNQNLCFKEIVGIALMFIINDSSKTYDLKRKFIEMKITNQMSSRTSTLTSFFTSFKYEKGYDQCFKNMWQSYNNMIFLTERWQERVSGLTTFDHSPEIFYILYLIFFVDLDCYAELFYTFSLPKGRIDRFDSIAENFVKHLQGLEQNCIISDFINCFSIQINDSNKDNYCSKAQSIFTKAKDAISRKIEEQENEKK